MKKIKFTTIILGVFMFLFTACVKDNDFSLPDVSIKVPEFKGKTITIAEVITKSSAEVTSYKEDHAIEGYVISSDQGGNFYKNIYLQSLDGKTAFSVNINKSGLYSEFPLGSKVQVRLKDLSTRVTNNRLEVGFGKSKYGVDAMPAGVYKKSVFRTEESADIKTLVNPIASLKTLNKDEFLCRLISIKNVSFEKAAQGKTYHQKANDKIYGTNYKIQDSEGGSLTFRTGKFAKYKDEIVPSEKVNITGIITKFKDYYQFMISTINDVEVIPGSATPEKPFESVTVATLNEKFDEVASYSDVNLKGWYTEAVKGDRKWQGKHSKDGSKKFIQATAYKSKLTEMETWIVTPGLDLAKANNKNFSFESTVGYAKGAKLEILISKDFDSKKGVAKAEWTALKATLPELKATGYSETTKSGDIDLKSYSGIVHIAFKYVGDDLEKSGSWQIDNVKFNYDPNAKEEEEPKATFTPKTVEMLNETFDGVEYHKDITLEGWFSATTKGDKNWQGASYQNNKSIQANTYGLTSEEMEAWIVTPGLNLTKATHKNFSFDSKRSKSKDETLEVYISSDFDYTKKISDAKWTKLENITLAPKTDSYSEYVNSSEIKLDAYSGTVFIAFKYTGNKTTANGSFKIDNVKFNYDPTANPDTGAGTDSDNTDNNTDNTTGGTTSPSTSTQALLFAGSDFNDWTAFKGALSTYSVQKYAVQADGGRNNSKALAIKTETTKNDYVFTALVPENFSTEGKTKITFYIKGTIEGKSISCNLYTGDHNTPYHRYNLSNCEADKKITPVKINSYSGAIDTKGKWIKITLDIKGLTDIASKKGDKLFALKIGSKATVDLLIDDITIE